MRAHRACRDDSVAARIANQLPCVRSLPQARAFHGAAWHASRLTPPRGLRQGQRNRTARCYGECQIRYASDDTPVCPVVCSASYLPSLRWLTACQHLELLLRTAARGIHKSCRLRAGTVPPSEGFPTIPGSVRPFARPLVLCAHSLSSEPSKPSRFPLDFQRIA